ncbi:MAG: hypothetical protein ACOC4G_06605 [Bacillota bacterium]
MKLKKFNYFIDILATSLYLISSLLLIQPWLEAIVRLFLDKNISSIQYIYLFSFSFVLFLLLKYLTVDMKRLLAFLFISIYFFLNIILNYFLGWNLFVFFPVLILLSVLLYYFLVVVANEHFIKYIVSGTLVIIISLFFKEFIQGYHPETLIFEISLLNIIVFYFFSLFILLLFNIRYMKLEGYKIPYGTLLLSIAAIIIAVFLLSCLLSLASNDSVFELFITAFNYLIYPLAWVIVSIGGYFANFVSNRGRLYEEQSRSGPSFQTREGKFSEIIIPSYVYFIFFLILLFILIYYCTKKFKTEIKEKENTYIEERESIFSLEDIKKDFKKALSSFKNRFIRENKLSQYDDKDPVEIIRGIYYKFLILFNQRFKYQKYETAVDYLYKIKNVKDNSESLDINSIAELCNLYNKARYSGKVSPEEAELAQFLFDKIEEEENRK